MTLAVSTSALVLVISFVWGVFWFGAWFSLGRSVSLVLTTLMAKTLVTLFRFYIAVEGSEGVELTSDTYRYLAYGELAASSQDIIGELLVSGDETERVIAFSGMLFMLLGDSWASVYLLGSILGLFAMWITFGSILKIFRHVPTFYGYALCLFPSSLYWSSSLGKESLTLFGLSLGAFGAVTFWRPERRHSKLLGLFSICVGLAVLLSVRSEIGILFGLALLAAVFVAPGVQGAPGRGELRTSRLWVFVFVVPGLLLVLPALGYGTSGIADNLLNRHENTNIGESQVGASRPEGILGLALGVPISVFRPFPWEAGIGGLVSSLDTPVLVAATVSAFRSYSLFQGRARDLPVVRYWIFSGVVVLGLFAALAGYANLGLLVRMRSMCIPFVLSILFVWALARKGKSGSSEMSVG